MKKWYQSKTMWVNIGLVTLSLIELFTNNNLVPVQYQPAIPVVIGVVNLYLRLITNQPIQSAS